MLETLFSALLISLKRTIISYIISLFISIILGWGIGIVISLFKKNLSPVLMFFDLLRPIPSIVLIPFAILLFGIGDKTRQILAIFGAIWPILLNTVDGISNVDLSYVEVGRSLRLNKFEIFLHIILPASFPNLFTGIRTSSSVILIIIISTEMLIGNYGLGAYLVNSQLSGKTMAVYIGFFLIGTLGYFLNFILIKLQKFLLPWYQTFTENL